MENLNFVSSTDILDVLGRCRRLPQLLLRRWNIVAEKYSFRVLTINVLMQALQGRFGIEIDGCSSVNQYGFQNRCGQLMRVPLGNRRLTFLRIRNDTFSGARLRWTCPDGEWFLINRFKNNLLIIIIILKSNHFFRVGCADIPFESRSRT